MSFSSGLRRIGRWFTHDQKHKDHRWDYSIEWDNKCQHYWVTANTPSGEYHSALYLSKDRDECIACAHKHALTIREEETLHLGKLPPDGEAA